jgi:serine/threonine protein kinase, bacterial
MLSAHCSQGHQNPPGSRFCHMCGEQLTPVAGGITPGMVLGDRYRIVRELGAGGFGRTYLAEDINRFNELCVLKEFAPQVRGTFALQKSEELFEREAGVLYKLQHPQIPHFREMFRADFGSQGHLFLVQDYIEGQTYRQLLESRRSRVAFFTEAEVTQLLVQLLPVLDYIHWAGVIHRDISPDNLILRTSDQLPVLIDFGGVKRIAAVAASQYVEPDQPPPHVTRLGKVGYAPIEQMQSGRVFPHSDLYSLAVTILVLLTGEEPQYFLGDGIGTPNWQRRTHLSPNFKAVLEGMLAAQPVDRYQSAAEVLQALSGLPVDFSAVATQPPSSYPAPGSYPAIGNYAVPGNYPAPVNYPEPSASYPPPLTYPDGGSAGTVAVSPYPTKRSKQRKSGSGFGCALVFLLLLGALAGAGWWFKETWLPLITEFLFANDATNPSTTSSDFSADEQARKAALRDRQRALGIDSRFLIRLTDASFIQRYPEKRGRTLTTEPNDAEWRSRWDAIATEWLDLLSNTLSSDARRNLGRYDEADRDGWKRTVNQLYVSTRALNDLTDARFFNLFPDLREQNFIDQPVGQVWQAMASDGVRGLQSGDLLDRIQFDSGEFSQQASGSLNPGEGRVYVANLSQEQILRLRLQAPRRSTLLSIYLPRPTPETPVILEDSRDVQWSGSLPQSGFYEIVVVSTSDQPLDYTLNLSVDNVTSSPIAPETPEKPDAKD